MKRSRLNRRLVLLQRLQRETVGDDLAIIKGASARHMIKMPMAQHHGVPTPLLDWTSDAYIAMYFAATRGVKQLVKTESFDALADQQIVVWATFQEFFHYSVIDPFTSQSTSIDPTPVPLADFYPYRIYLVDPPRHYNPNLTAQRGKFTLVQKMTQGKDTSEFNHDDVFGLPDLETVWSEMVKAPQVVAAHWHSAVLYKFSLPVKKATTLLKILKMRNYVKTFILKLGFI
jgi:hypothetical protein